MLALDFLLVIGLTGVSLILGLTFIRRLRQKRRPSGPADAEHEHSRAILEQAEDGYLSLDADRHILYANPAAFELLGETPDHLIGQPVTQLFPDLAHAKSGLKQSLQPSSVLSAMTVQTRTATADGSTLIRLQLLQTARPQTNDVAASQALRSTLYNRQGVLERLRDAVALAHAKKNRLAVAIIDLDQFQRINESLGHTVGDQVLDVMAQRLADHVQQPNILGRLGSDEFVAILLDAPEEKDCIQSLQELQRKLAAPITSSPIQPIVVTVSIGVSMITSASHSADSLLRKADSAVHQAKKKGRGQLVWNDDDLTVIAQTELQTEQALRRALQNQEVWLAYQPQIDLHSGDIIGCEALIRWNHPTLGQVPPDLFIPIAESAGLIVPLGRWVLNTACRDAERMLAVSHKDFLMSVNVSAQQFLAGDIVEDVQSALAESNLRPSCLELEITESLLIHDHEQVSGALHTLRNLGVRVAIDDFGTGYSSLAYLLRYPVDKLKIDRSFIEHLSSNTHDAKLTSAIITMAHELGLSVVAEGVEQTEQSAFLSEHACDIAQGYLYGRAIPADAFLRSLQLPRNTGIS